MPDRETGMMWLFVLLLIVLVATMGQVEDRLKAIETKLETDAKGSAKEDTPSV